LRKWLLLLLLVLAINCYGEKEFELRNGILYEKISNEPYTGTIYIDGESFYNIDECSENFENETYNFFDDYCEDIENVKYYKKGFVAPDFYFESEIWMIFLLIVIIMKNMIIVK